MKKYLILILIIGFVAFISSCALKNQMFEETKVERVSNNQKELIFEKNQECLKYKDDLEKKLQNKRSPFGEASLEQIFYSPKQNSCLYVEYTKIQGDLSSGEYSFNRRLFDILNDGENAHPLNACLNAKPIGTDCEEFDKYLEEYKK